MHPDIQQPSPLPSETIAPHHAELLEQSGITTQFAADHGVRSVLTDAELPEEFEGHPRASTPGLLFEWNSPSGKTVFQLRPDDPPEIDGRKAKYIFPVGQHPVLNRVDENKPGKTVLIIEGTRQSLAAAEYARPGLEVYALAGCWGWRSGDTGTSIPDLSVVEGKEVCVLLDADARTNLDVYTAGESLRDALELEGAEWVRFPRLPAGKKAGLDDVLGVKPADQRTGYLTRLIETCTKASTAADRNRLGKPADTKPKPKKDEKAAKSLDPARRQVDATDLDVADAFVDLHGRQVLFNRTTGQWNTYHDGLWDSEGGEKLAEALYQDMVRHEIQAVVRDGDGELVEAREWIRCAPRIKHVLHHVSANRRVQVTAKELDPDPWKWNAANCVIDLRPGLATSVHDPSFRMTQQSPVVYDPDAECPEFMRFIEWALPDESVRRYVQKVLGVAMIGKTVLQHLYVFTGDGRNGKGTLLRLTAKVFGTYATGIKDDVLVETKFESHATKLATFFKKRLAATDELPAHSKWNVALVKKLTGGDSITANYMRQDDFTFEPSHSLILSTNHRPHVGENEYAFWRRYREVPFTQTLADSEIDEGLEERIAERELSGVLNWLLDGLDDWHNEGLPVPEAVTEASDGTQRKNNPLWAFINDTIVQTGDVRDVLTGPDVADSYKKWIGERRDVVPVKGAKFHREFCILNGLDWKSGDDSKDAGRERHGKDSKVRLYRKVRFVTDDDLVGGVGAADSAAAAADRAADPSGGKDDETPGRSSSAAAAADAAGIYDGQAIHAKQREPSSENKPSQSPDRRETAAAPAAQALPDPVAPTFSQVTPSTVSAADWVDLFCRTGAPALPDPECRDCGRSEGVDPELGVFRLCPSCTSGTLRPTTDPGGHR